MHQQRRLFAADLIEAGACTSQVEAFRELFPAGVVPTLELCLQHAGTFAWGWAAEKLLSSRGRAAYNAATAQAWAAHDAARDQAWAAIKAARNQAWDAANEEAWDQAWVAYKAATDQATYDAARAQAAYKAAAARAWFEQWSYEAGPHDAADNNFKKVENNDHTL